MGYDRIGWRFQARVRYSTRKAWPSTRLPRVLSHTEIQSLTPRGLYITHMQVNVFPVFDILLGALRDVTESQQ
jgi:hypothetical protein